MSEAPSWSDSSCDVWLLPDGGSSRWSRRIDWYLNFQAMKAEAHLPLELSAQLKSIEEQWPIDREPLVLAPTAPLMIASRGHLPCSKAIFIGFAGDVRAWVDACVSSWRGLGKPSVRIFLPDTVTQDEFRAAWVKGAGVSEAVPESIPVSLLEA